jgi:hypothetical protein
VFPIHIRPTPPRQHRDLFKAWRALTPDQLADRVLLIRRLAVRQHFAAADWRALDRMRDRLAAMEVNT